jgi:hypothetical protein
MQTLKDLLEKAKEIPSLKTDPDWEKISGIFDIYLPWSDDSSLTRYWLKPWLCTDQLVGQSVYYLNNEPVCISEKSCRKCDTTFQWLTLEKAEKTRTYLSSLVNTDTENFIDVIDESSLTETLEYYSVNYNSQIIHKTAMWNNQIVKIEKTIFHFSETNSLHKVIIKTSDDTTHTVMCDELFFKYNQPLQ